MKARTDGIPKVYFIRAGRGPVKIGFTTKTPRVRMHELQCGNHEVLTLLLCMPGTAATERAFHRMFAHLLVRGEWFRPARELLSHVATLAKRQSWPTTASSART